MPRSCCVKNCSNNAKSQPNMNFYILPSNKQRRERWLQAIGRAQQRLRFCTPRYLVGQLNAKELYFCSFVKSMHQIFTQMYLIKVVFKKILFWFITPFLRIWTSQQISPKQVHAISTAHHPPHPSKEVQETHELSRQ